MQVIQDERVVYTGNARDFLSAAPTPEAALNAYRRLIEFLPDASEGTRRKWRKTLDLQFGIVP